MRRCVSARQYDETQARENGSIVQACRVHVRREEEEEEEEVDAGAGDAWVAAADCARLAKDPLDTVPPDARAVAL
jgi:hypothetical protein